MTVAHELTRVSAFVAFACYTIAVAWGVALTARSFRPPLKPQFDYHRFVAALGAVALVVHVVTVVATHANGVQIEALVYVRARPAAVAGVTAFWLALAIPLSFRVRRRGVAAAGFWRGLHYTAYLVWALALLHGLGAGTDTRTTLGLATYGGSAAIVGAAVWWRWFEHTHAVRVTAPANGEEPT